MNLLLTPIGDIAEILEVRLLVIVHMPRLLWRRQMRSLRCELFIEIGNVFHVALQMAIVGNLALDQCSTYCHAGLMVIVGILTMVGMNGGFTFRSNRSSHDVVLKNACFFTSSASRSDEPSRRSGFLRSNCKEMCAICKH